MGWLSALVQRAIRAVAAHSERHHHYPLQTPNLNALGLAWAEASGLGPAMGLKPADPAYAAQQRGFRYITEYMKTDDPAVLEQAIECFERAVDLTPEGPRRPVYLSELGGALRERFIRRPQARTDLERMVALFEEARNTINTQDRFRPSIVNNLGNAYHLRQDPGDLDREIECYEEALKTEQAGSKRPGWANNLSNALKNRFRRTRQQEDLDRAIDLARMAAYSPEADPAARCQFLSGFAEALQIRFAIANQPRDQDESIVVSKQAVSLTEDGSLMRAALLSNYGLALAMRYASRDILDDLKAAISAWEGTWSIVYKNFFSSAVAYKLGQQQQWTNLPMQLVTAYVELYSNDPADKNQIIALRRMLEIIEASRSRLLVELIGREALPHPAGTASEDFSRENTILNALTELDMEDLVAESDPSGAPLLDGRTARFQKRRTYVGKLEEVWQKIARAGPEGQDYVANRRGEPLQWDELVQLAERAGSDTLLLSVFPSSTGRSVLLALRAGWDTPLSVPMELTPEEWLDGRDRLVEEVHNYNSAMSIRETWDTRFRQIIKGLLDDRVAPLLQGVRRCVVAASGIGNLVPWAAIIFRAGWRDEAGQPISVVTVPAFSVLTRRQIQRQLRGPALVVGNAGEDNRLHYAVEEAKIVGQILGVVPLLGDQATKAEVLNRLPEAKVVHFAAHGRFTQDSPLDSGIELADGFLSAREILTKRLNADLVVLSACETGGIRSLGGDEFVGLGQSFLQAGARSIVASLWRVEDKATGVLARSFYEALKYEDKAVALNRAMSTVRQQREWSHPYYWAPFIISGDWRSE
jgi:tetratricopeptide (TPR) repeat protein